jgi:outer membrane protein assembly factor BamA
LRATYDGVAGAFKHVPFVDLPTLGGSQLLGSYPVDRFRDRHAATGSLKYQWDVERSVAAFLFTDVGRMWRDDDALARGDLRMSYGGGLQFGSSGSIAVDRRVEAARRAPGRLNTDRTGEPGVRATSQAS